MLGAVTICDIPLDELAHLAKQMQAAELDVLALKVNEGASLTDGSTRQAFVRLAAMINNERVTRELRRRKRMH